MTIRRAKATDVYAAIELLRGDYLAAGFDRADGPTGMSFDFEPARAHALFDFHLLSPTSCCLILEKDDVARGIIMASFSNHPFCGARVAQTVVWYIEPFYRGFGAAVRMLDAYEAWSREKGCAFAGLATMSGFPQLAKFFERRGYKPAESYHLKAL